jgi:hypothetical protein
MLSIKREAHHIPLLERFCADAPEPETDDPVAKMVHRLGTKKGRLLYGLRKQTVERKRSGKSSSKPIAELTTLHP